MGERELDDIRFFLDGYNIDFGNGYDYLKNVLYKVVYVQ